ncbi:hypothetical protein PVAP13_2NG277303 [Panicum virgatum]|uniref:Uncharacterized protein n=1 Tax=Panicum virgatum TaxID=38727 RepID=A0A8T0VKU3_PANVG|nr:hypothetical protein PVAP13_2NG277303 [Panicum virgatum]
MSMFFLRHQKSADAAMAVACRRREQAGADHAREHLRLRELEPGGACPGRAASAWWSRRATAPRARRWPSSVSGPPTSARSSARPAAWTRAAATPRSWPRGHPRRRLGRRQQGRLPPRHGVRRRLQRAAAPACGSRRRGDHRLGHQARQPRGRRRPACRPAQ